MNAREIGLLEFLRQADQLTIPIYQRQFSWTQPEWEQLWDDIAFAAKHDRDHFVGSIVYVYEREPAIGQVVPAQVIDGQQRLTTITVLLNALLRQVASLDGRKGEAQRLRSRYLFNADEAGANRYKLVLTRSDRETLMRLLEAYQEKDDASARILAADRYFARRLSQPDSDCDEILRGLHHLMTVSVALARSNDNPQAVFDSLNSTGLDLAEGDRIRNFVLMDLPPEEQEQVYSASWYPMEELFRGQEPTTFDRFVRDYLTAMTAQIPRIDRVYEAFKKYADLSSLTRLNLVDDLFRHARLWCRIALGREPNPAIAAVQLKVDVSYPFLMTLLADFEARRMTEDELITLLRLVETYVFRRAVCAIPTNTLNKTFATLPGEVNEERYFESTVAAFLLKESYFRMPSDEEFRTQLSGRDIYNFRPRNYLLGKLENFDRNEVASVTEYTIEHVMPQNPDLPPEWQEELGPNWSTIQEKLLHTIGNLTLTGYNSKYSDRPFADKKAMTDGFQDSPIRLNEFIARCEHWNEEAITTRARELADRAVRVWAIPPLSEAVLTGYRRSKLSTKSSYTLEDHETLTGDLRILFDDLERRILNLDSGITREIRKLYIAYRFAGNVACVVPRRSDLVVYLAASVSALDDPDSHIRDVRGIGHWGSGDSEVVVTSTTDFSWVLPLIQQVLDRQMEDGASAPSESEFAVERILELADVDMQPAARALLEVALSHALYPRPWKRALMFTPPTNHLWQLLTISFGADGKTFLGIGGDAFEKFYSTGNDVVAKAFGLPLRGWTVVDPTRVRATADALDQLMSSIAAGTVDDAASIARP